MNAHVYAYLQNLTWEVMGAVPRNHTRLQAARAILGAVKQYPEHHRQFIANATMSALGYGGGI